MFKNYLLTHRRIIAIGVLSIAGIILITLWVLDLLRSTTVSILVTPSEAMVSINGDNYTNGTYRIFPTENAMITIKAPGFEEKNFSLDFPANSTVAIQDYLVNNTEGLSYYENSQEDYDILKLVAKDDAALDFISNFERVLSVKDYLPLVYYPEGISRTGITEITDGSDDGQCRKIVCLRVSAVNMDPTTAKRLLSEKGFDYDDYQIILSDYTGF